MSGRAVLVTGGTSRLGLAIADALRRAGWRVLTSSHRACAGADCRADLSLPGAADRLFTEVRALLGGRPPDALVNNAALFAGDAAAVRAVGFEAPARLTELMAARTERGTVVNVLDAAVLAPDDPPGRSAAYSRAKRDLHAETLLAARRYARTLTVNAVAPGPVSLAPGFSEKAPPTPLGRPDERDVAEAVVYLLGARATTGCVIPVDGGAGVEML